MTPSELESYLGQIIASNIKHSLMIWGKPGIGKSAVVKALCESKRLKFIDLRLSQLMPTDLRGVPVPVDGVTHWFPPSFFPKEGCGVLFMDELNMAPPALQGVAQQLILDRRVGDYSLPDGWFIWAAGNERTDKAAVYEMPGPLANRFIHLKVEASLEAFKQYAYGAKLSPDIIGFLSFRPDLLHMAHATEPNWPSPRSWQIASNLHVAGLQVAPAIGSAAALEFEAFCRLKDQVPDIDGILAGDTSSYFPNDPSVRFATISGLVSRVASASHAANALFWLIQVAEEEWVHMYAVDIFPQLRSAGQYGQFSKLVIKNSAAKAFLGGFAALMAA